MEGGKQPHGNDGGVQLLPPHMVAQTNGLWAAVQTIDSLRITVAFSGNTNDCQKCFDGRAANLGVEMKICEDLVAPTEAWIKTEAW